MFNLLKLLLKVVLLQVGGSICEIKYFKQKVTSLRFPEKHWNPFVIGEVFVYKVEYDYFIMY